MLLAGLLVVGLFQRDGGFGPRTLPGLFYGGGGRLLAIQVHAPSLVKPKRIL